jgi:hypothetical protein
MSLKTISFVVPANFAKKFAPLSFLLAILAMPTLASVTVNSPSNGSEVGAPLNLSAIATTCSSQSVAAMGFSFDSSADTTVIPGTSIEASIGSAAGTHTLHVKAWGDQGASCVTDVTFTVKTATTPTVGGPVIPSDAVSVSSIQAMANWQADHDDGGPGQSNGSTQLVSSPSLFGTTRKFETQYSGSGDERYSVSFSDDTNATNFLYDAWVYLTDSANHVANLEMDVNQVMANGQTVLIGVQCDGYSGTWDYTVNKGTAALPQPNWVIKNGTKCNPHEWTRRKWHHVQATFSRDESGIITYHSVWLDGTETKLDVKVYGGASLGWGPSIITQFQVDGLGSKGSTTVYLDSLTISRW